MRIDSHSAISAGMGATAIWLSCFLLLKGGMASPLMVLLPVMLGPLAGLGGLAVNVMLFGRASLSSLRAMVQVHMAIFTFGGLIAALIVATVSI